MYVIIIGLFLSTFQMSCDGAPGPRMMIKHVQKRAAGCPPDKYDKYSCTVWKKGGDCMPSSQWYKWVRDNCHATCGFCTMPTASPPPPTPVPEVDPVACLQAHNAKRALHGVSTLVWDAQLAQRAKAWADHLLPSGTFKHEQNTGEGENLAWFSASHVKTCSDAVEGWYDEIKDYDFKSPGFSSGTGHFTAVVWKSTTKLGAALAKTVKNNGQTVTYVVARYLPAGNVLNHFAENVPPLVKNPA